MRRKRIVWGGYQGLRRGLLNLLQVNVHFSLANPYSASLLVLGVGFGWMRLNRIDNLTIALPFLRWGIMWAPVPPDWAGAGGYGISGEVAGERPADEGQEVRPA